MEDVLADGDAAPFGGKMKLFLAIARKVQQASRRVTVAANGSPATAI